MMIKTRIEKYAQETKEVIEERTKLLQKHLSRTKSEAVKGKLQKEHDEFTCKLKSKVLRIKTRLETVLKNKLKTHDEKLKKKKTPPKSKKTKLVAAKPR
jgi:transcriptional regulator of heat shock response